MALAVAPPRPRRRLSPGTPFAYLAGVVVIGITVVPLLFVVLGGFRTNAQLNYDPAGLPHPWVLTNYVAVLANSAFWTFLFNSLVIALIATALALVLGAMAGFALSRYNFRGREALYGLFTLGLLFPLTVAALPLFLWLKDLNLLENPLGVAIPEAAFSLPVTIIILRPFMAAIPSELEDAAVLDGATRLGFFVRVLLPLSMPALTTVAVLAEHTLRAAELARGG